MTAAGRSRRNRVLLVALAALPAIAVMGACGNDRSVDDGARLPTAEEMRRQGGDGTVADEGASAFAQSMPGLTNAERRTFAVGNSFFNQNWVTAPASTTGRDGLGPIFNAQSCSSCHFKDGRGRPPADPDDPERGLLMKVGVLDADGNVVPHPELGSQFQDRSIRDVPAEGSVRIDVTERSGRYADGTEYSLAAPEYSLLDAAGTSFTGLLMSPRVAPAMMGVGLLENVPDATIEAGADPEDRDDDGVSGRVRRTTDPATGDDAVGRFGWKGGMPTILGQTTAAFANDVGITSSIFGDQPCTESQVECAAAPDGGTPEIDDAKLDQMVFYSRTLAVPARRRAADPATRDGQRAFQRIGCASCHTPELTTGPSDIEPLDRQTIRPFTDLLLHDMGPLLADDLGEGPADGNEWRTPALWGIGLVDEVNGHTRFLHDGRARSIEEAILWHGGEAEGSKRRFTQLPAADRRRVLEFLESL